MLDLSILYSRWRYVSRIKQARRSFSLFAYGISYIYFYLQRAVYLNASLLSPHFIQVVEIVYQMEKESFYSVETDTTFGLYAVTLRRHLTEYVWNVRLYVGHSDSYTRHLFAGLKREERKVRRKKRSFAVLYCYYSDKRYGNLSFSSECSSILSPQSKL